MIPETGRGSSGPVTVLCGFSLTNYHYITKWSVNYTRQYSRRISYGEEGIEGFYNLYFRYDLTNKLSRKDSSEVRLIPMKLSSGKSYRFRRVFYPEKFDNTWQDGFTDFNKELILNIKKRTITSIELPNPYSDTTTISFDSDSYRISYSSINRELGSGWVDMGYWHTEAEFVPSDSLVTLEQERILSVPFQSQKSLAFDAYPNPARGTVTIEWSETTAQKILITDIQGKLLSSYKIDPNEHSKVLDLSNLPKYLYIKLQTRHGSSLIKVLQH